MKFRKKKILLTEHPSYDEYHSGARDVPPEETLAEVTEERDRFRDALELIVDLGISGGSISSIAQEALNSKIKRVVVFVPPK